jgi:hypothetical protein
MESDITSSLKYKNIIDDLSRKKKKTLILPPYRVSSLRKDRKISHLGDVMNSMY